MSVEYARNYRKVRKAVSPARRRRVYASMVYRCQGKRFREASASGSAEEAAKALEESGCGFEHRIYLGIGCEGPPALKEAGTWIPVPMHAGVCQNCGGGMIHVRWNEDEEFGEKDAPEGAALFIVPGKGTANGYSVRGYGGAELIRTEGEKAAIRKFHGPQAPER